MASNRRHPPLPAVSGRNRALDLLELVAWLVGAAVAADLGQDASMLDDDDVAVDDDDGIAMIAWKFDPVDNSENASETVAVVVASWNVEVVVVVAWLRTALALVAVVRKAESIEVEYYYSFRKKYCASLLAKQISKMQI